MKDNKKVVHPKNLPTRLPIQLTAIIYLLMDKFQPTELIWGIVGTFVVLLWIGFLISLFNETYTDIFGTKVKDE